MIKNTLMVLSLLGIVACTGKGNSSETDGRLTWDCEYVKMSDSNNFATINLKDRFDKEDFFDAREVIGGSYILDSILKIRIKTDAEIVKAVKISHLYPTIWSDEDDEALQFIYLFDINYNDTLPLQVSKGFIDYPYNGEGSPSAIKAFFDNITKSQILSSIDKVPEEYEKNGTLCSYEMDSWEKESKVWKEIAESYTLGEFTDSINEPFDVAPYEIDLVVTFKRKNEVFTKTFHDEAVIGN